jgi:carboxymethylenebutenolidase
MRRLEVRIPAPNGVSDWTLHGPDVDGPWPGVLMFPDASVPPETSGQWDTG